MIQAIPAGRSAAVTTRALAERLGMTARELQLSIEAARREGVPILSCSEGYFLAQSVAEVDEWVESQRRRIRSQLASVRGVRKWRRGRGQMALWA